MQINGISFSEYTKKLFERDLEDFGTNRFLCDDSNPLTGRCYTTMSTPETDEEQEVLVFLGFDSTEVESTMGTSLAGEGMPTINASGNMAFQNRTSWRFTQAGANRMKTGLPLLPIVVKALRDEECGTRTMVQCLLKDVVIFLHFLASTSCFSTSTNSATQNNYHVRRRCCTARGRNPCV